MCGIAGQARSDGRRVEHDLLAGMCDAMRHRGPDGRGLHASEGIGLGMQRLAVIDLATGDQPIFNEDRSVAVILNGEIYNFRELREQLEARGHRFATASDTEVIVHLYEERGSACVEALHGMFAFALWDARERRLLLARDRVGKKPLFYAERGDVLSFASELNALLRDPAIERELDHQALDAYFAFRWVPTPMSAFRAVRKLPPASTLVWQDGRSTVERYWKLDYSRKRTFADEAELHETIRDTIRRATRRRMIADVPLGAFLSGGVDSAAVVAAMAEASPQPVKTFTIGFGKSAVDELPLARGTAERFGTDHHELVVEPKAIDIIGRIVRHYGEPFADSSAIPSFYLAELARRSVTVALNGDGGDESFGGYPRYVAHAAMARADRLPALLRRSAAALGGRVPENERVDSWPSRVRRMSHGLRLDQPGRYTAYLAALDGLDRSRLYTPEYAELVGAGCVDSTIRTPWERSTASDVVDVMLDVDTQTYLPDYLLTKVDIATMAASLEARSPLLDHELMELAASLPSRMKVRGMEKKVSLRGALRGWVPDAVLDAPKQGFRPPIADWFRHELRGYVHDVLLDPGTTGRGYFDAGYVETLIDRHVAGVADCSKGLWTLMCFELWHRELVDRAARTPELA